MARQGWQERVETKNSGKVSGASYGIDCKSNSDCEPGMDCRSKSGGGAECRPRLSIETNDRANGGMECQSKADCNSGMSCRSKKGGGSECR